MKFRLLGVLLLGLLLLSCSKKENGGGAVLPTVPVKTSIVELGKINVTRQFTGGLVGVEQADLYIRLSEAVTALPYKAGDYVKEGAVVVRLELGGTSSSYYQAKASYDNAQKNYEKMKNLFDQGAISESQYDNAEAAFKVAKANFTAASGLVEMTAPISGRIVELNVKVGDIPAVGTVAAKIARTDMLRMTIGVPDNVVDRFSVGMVGDMTVGNTPDTFQCRVTEVSEAADPATRTFSVDLRVPNTDGKLQAGMFGKATFVIDHKDNVITVDRNALLSTEGLYEVFVVEHDTAYSRRVNIGIVNDVHTEIISGLKSGDEVVVVGQAFLSDGYPIVRTKDQANDSI
jgi:RND family efflux transporter MFP subunit